MNTDLLELAKKNLIIQDVFLHSSEIKTRDDYFPLSLGNEIEVQFKNFVQDSLTLEAENQNGKKQSLVRYRYTTAFRVLPPGLPEEIKSDPSKIEEKTIIEVIATFVALYALKQEIPKDSMAEFAKFNVGYHVWPYWREYASSTSNRLRLPVFSIPLYTIPVE